MVRTRWRGIIAIAACVVATSGCSATDVPRFSGVVVDRESGEPIANAVVLIAYTGKTKARETWWLVHSNFDMSRCVRLFAMSDAQGRFETESLRVGAHFGDPTIEITAYADQYRSYGGGVGVRVDGVSSLKVSLWSEESAERYTNEGGDPIDYGKVVNPERLRMLQRDRQVFLDAWLSSQNSMCEYEPHREQVEQFLQRRFEDWLNGSSSTPLSELSRACGPLASLQLDGVKFANDFVRAHSESLAARCSRTRFEK